MSNPTQSEGCGVGGNNNDIKMNSNPAYAGVEYTADEGEDIAWIWICTKVYVCSQFNSGVLLQLYSKHCNCMMNLTGLLIMMYSQI